MNMQDTYSLWGERDGISQCILAHVPHTETNMFCFPYDPLVSMGKWCSVETSLFVVMHDKLT